MVWGEHANWSFNTSDYQAFEAYIPEWTSLVERDFNHPIFDLHDYDQNPETFRARYEPFKNGGELDVDYNTKRNGYNRPQTYRGEPVCISEYGGIKWDVDGGIVGWGYGNAPQSEEEFVERYTGLTKALLENPNIFGFCYTQLYDVEQEKNGLYTYSRKPKFDIEIFRKINTVKAAIED